VKQSQHHDDEVIGRCLDEHLTVESDEVETWLNQPAEQVTQHVTMLLEARARQLQTHSAQPTLQLVHLYHTTNNKNTSK